MKTNLMVQVAVIGLLLAVSASAAVKQRPPSATPGIDPGMIIIKFRPADFLKKEINTTGAPDLDRLMRNNGVTSLKRIFTHTSPGLLAKPGLINGLEQNRKYHPESQYSTPSFR